MAFDYDINDIKIATYPQKASFKCDRWEWVAIAPDGKTRLGSDIIDGSDSDAKRAARAFVSRLAKNASRK